MSTLQVKSLFGQLQVDFKVIELDQLGAPTLAIPHATGTCSSPGLTEHGMLLTTEHGCAAVTHAEDGQDVQDALHDVTGRHTVPQVFVKGAFIGGADGVRTPPAAQPTSPLLAASSLQQLPQAAPLPPLTCVLLLRRHPGKVCLRRAEEAVV
jgi:glutaredoxin-related protein